RRAEQAEPIVIKQLAVTVLGRVALGGEDDLAALDVADLVHKPGQRAGLVGAQDEAAEQQQRQQPETSARRHADSFVWGGLRRRKHSTGRMGVKRIGLSSGRRRKKACSRPFSPRPAICTQPCSLSKYPPILPTAVGFPSPRTREGKSIKRRA